MSSNEWYTKTDDGEQGPHIAWTLNEMAKAGTIKPTSLVRETNGSWVKAEELDFLAETFNAIEAQRQHQQLQAQQQEQQQTSNDAETAVGLSVGNLLIVLAPFIIGLVVMWPCIGPVVSSVIPTELIIGGIILFVVLIIVYMVRVPNILKNMSPEEISTTAWGPLNPAMICPHCQEKGKVRLAPITQKKGISGGKATGAILTGGISLLATGLSRKENNTQAHCDNCEATWIF